MPHHAEIAARIIQAAAEVFAQHGFHGARVRDIVRTADVNLAAVNYYFGGKEGLYAATLKELAARRLTEHVSTGRDEPPEHALRRHIHIVVERVLAVEKESALGRIIAHESMNPTPYFDSIVADVMRPELERLQGIIARLAPSRAAEVVAADALSVMGQCFFYLLARGAVQRLHPDMLRPENATALADHIADFSLAALRSEA